MEKNIIEKSNILNTMQKIDYDMSLNEFRLFCMYLSKLNSRKPEKRTAIISISDFEKLFDVKFNTSLFRKRIRSVASANVEIQEEKKISIVQLYSRFAWVDSDTCTELEITCNQDIQKYIFELQKNYTSYRLENIAKLTSLVKIRLYELMKQYEFVKSIELKLEDLQRMIFSVEKRFNDFRSRVLEPAVQDINKYTDITVSYEKILKCRKCVALKFFIESKAEKEKISVVENQEVKQISDIEHSKTCKNLYKKYFTSEHEEVFKKNIRIMLQDIYKSEIMIKERTEVIYKQCVTNFKINSQTTEIKSPSSYMQGIINNIIKEEIKNPKKEKKRSYDVNQFEKFAINYAELQKVENEEVSENNSEPVLEPVKETKVICQEKVKKPVIEPLSTISDDVEKMFDETEEGKTLFSKVVEALTKFEEYSITVSVLDLISKDWRKYEGFCKEIITDKLKEKENAPKSIDVFNKI